MGQLVRWLAVGMSILNWFVASGVLLSASALTVSPASPDVISDVNALAANAKSLSSETGSVADDIIGKLNDADKEVKEQEEKLKVAETEKNTELAKLNAEVKSKSDAATASLADANAKVSAVQEKANADVKAAKEQAEQEKTAVKNQAEREKQKLEFEASEASRKAAAADQLLADTAAKANNDVANAQAKVDAEVARQTADTTSKAKADVDGAKSAAIKQVSDQNAKLAADKDKAVADGAAAKDAYSSIQNQIRTAKNDVISKISGIFDSLLAKAVAQAQAA